MKFYISIFIAFCVFSCDAPEQVVVKPGCVRDWEDIRADSVITILAENSPVSYFVYRGRNMGYEYELLYEFAKDMNLRIQIKMVHDLDTMVHLLENCEGDFIAPTWPLPTEGKNGLSFSSSSSHYAWF
ncbi:MAG: hypothetical protein IPG07_21765 [Crocinitomicaceae bacterium]|nr:hypothetical protein [Crocinitomicaceae bacterium]